MNNRKEIEEYELIKRVIFLEQNKNFLKEYGKR